VVTEVSAGDKVTLSSAVSQANALSVEWNFGDGDTETVSTDEFSGHKSDSRIQAGGEHTITERSTPTICRRRKSLSKGPLEGHRWRRSCDDHDPAELPGSKGRRNSDVPRRLPLASPTPTVQWQLSTNGGGTWSDVSGATADTLKVEHTTVSESGYEYQGGVHERSVESEHRGGDADRQGPQRSSGGHGKPGQ